MGITRREIHPTKINLTADQLKAIAHPARLRILLEVSRRSDCVCTDLSETVGLAQATVSQHLRILRDSGFIKGSIEGNSVCYCINKQLVEDFASRFEGLLTELLNSVEKNSC